MKNTTRITLLAATALLFLANVNTAQAGGNIHFSGGVYGDSITSLNKCVNDAVYHMQAQRCSAAGEIPVVSTVRDIVTPGARPIREVEIYSY